MTTTSRWGTAVVWFRRDLRLEDHPALWDAVTHARNVVPLFVADQRLVHVSAARSTFLAGSLAALDSRLRDRGSRLTVRSGPAEAAVAEFARELAADVVIATRDITPFSYRRDAAVARALRDDGRELLLRPGTTLVEPEDLLSGAGKPYGVFTPFWRTLQRAPRRTLRAAPTTISTDTGALPDSEVLPAHPDQGPPHADTPEPGEAAAQERLNRWFHGGLAGYRDGRNDLGGAATSHLGADLHFGTLSPLQVESATAERGEEAVPFTRQLAWREFYHHLLFHQRADPSRSSNNPLMAAFRAERDDPAAATAWREGRTGVPVVDAGMRQLLETGWLSNRARLVVASFLTRHLLMDYRIGERHFLRHLIDGDVANNLGGWQWTAGVGADAQPWFRIFNPVLQGRRFDPEGVWVARWVPELAAVPARFIHAPWEMDDAAAIAIGFRLGSDYPRPIIGLAEGRERALAAFRSISP